jgi:uncharacterized membrane protein YphA (DoxX/SURF4 family)
MTLGLNLVIRAVPVVGGIQAHSVAFSCPVVAPDRRLSRIDALSERIRMQLLHRFGIDHPVLQFETVECGEGTMLCGLLPGSEGSGPGGSPAPSVVNSSKTFFEKPLQFWIRLVLGAIFIIASADKIANPGGFAQAVHNYQILPDALINLTAIILPWLELFLGIFLIVGFWLPGTVTLANGLLVVFFGSLVFNVARGLDVHCGCFSTSTDGNPTTAWYLIRDAAFLLMGAYLFVAVVISRKPGNPTGAGS